VTPANPTTTAVTTTPIATKPGTSGPVEKALDVQAATAWTDTGIILKPGDKVSISSDGNLKFAEGVATPEGLPRTWRDVVRSLPLNAAGTGALIARIGDDPAVVPFLVGTKKEFVVSRPGRLFLGLNLGENERLDGGFKAKVQVTQPANGAEAKAADLKFDTKLFDEVPRRISDQAGGKGDMVNFILIGTVDQVKEAFASGGWVAVDKTKSDAVMHAILATVQKQSYLEMPMSELYLFGRPQDFGFARAEPVSVVQTRHHLRVWKAPFQLEGQDVWIGAATHDMGFEKDQRNGSVTHKIDPNVDLERDFVGASLTEGGAVLASSYNLPKDPIQEAKTATGGSFHSDGRVLVMQLRGAPNNANNVGH
jgi:LssY-like putative type I secretion system component LssY